MVEIQLANKQVFLFRMPSRLFSVNGRLSKQEQKQFISADKMSVGKGNSCMYSCGDDDTNLQIQFRNITYSYKMQ